MFSSSHGHHVDFSDLLSLLLTCVRRTATSLGSANVSCPPEYRAVGTFMSWTWYWGGVDWRGDKDMESVSCFKPKHVSWTDSLTSPGSVSPGCSASCFLQLQSQRPWVYLHEPPENDSNQSERSADTTSFYFSQDNTRVTNRAGHKNTSNWTWVDYFI